MFDRAGASGLTVKDFQDLILVNQIGQRRVIQLSCCLRQGKQRRRCGGR
jgi:hypothetical protein